MKKSYLDIYYLVVFELFSFIVLLSFDVRMPIGQLVFAASVAGYLAATFFYNLHDLFAYMIKNRIRLIKGKNSKRKRGKMPAFKFRTIPDPTRKKVRRSGFSTHKHRHRHHSHSESVQETGSTGSQE